uniref:Tyrosine specific protein phosphatases domain-containing protein n=1 Tax=Parascaris equorum TaxID=6256 RepID=A0A914S7T8_PAREQ
VPNLALQAIKGEKLWLEDSSEQYAHDNFDPYCDEIEMALHSGERVLVHSVKGISRSATLCLAYLTKYKFESLKEAFLFLASKRPLVRPNIVILILMLSVFRTSTFFILKCVGYVHLHKFHNELFNSLLSQGFFCFQEVKKTNGSVHLIRDKSDPDKVVPDVYSKSLAALKEANRKRQNRNRKQFLTKPYKPVLEPILEDVENGV